MLTWFRRSVGVEDDAARGISAELQLRQRTSMKLRAQRREEPLLHGVRGLKWKSGEEKEMDDGRSNKCVLATAADHPRRPARVVAGG